MHTNLMRAACTQPAAHQRIFAKALQHLILRHGIAAALLDNRHFLAVILVAGNLRLNHAAIRLDIAAHHSQIGTLRRFRLNLLRQRHMRRIILRANHNTAGVLIKTMHNARTDNTVDARQILAMIQQRIHQRTAVIAGSRMHHHAARLIDNHDILILIDDIQRNILRLHIQRLRLRQRHGNLLAQLQLVIRLENLSATHSTSLVQQLLHIRARKLQQRCQTNVGALAGLIFSNN